MLKGKSCSAQVWGFVFPVCNSRDTTVHHCSPIWWHHNVLAPRSYKHQETFGKKVASCKPGSMMPMSNEATANVFKDIFQA